MTRIVFMYMILCLFSCANSHEDLLDESGSNKLIDTCIKKYLLIKNANLPEDIDRVYMHIRSDMTDILFASGEMGVFGPRDQNYKSLLYCRILNQAEKVTILQEGYDFLLKTKQAQIDSDSFYSVPVMELLFLRKGDYFEFSKRQVFKKERVDDIYADPERE